MLREGFRAVERAIAAEVKLLPKPKVAGLAGMLLRELRECAGLKGGTPRSSEAKPKALAPPGGVVATAGARPPVSFLRGPMRTNVARWTASCMPLRSKGISLCFGGSLGLPGQRGLLS